MQWFAPDVSTQTSYFEGWSCLIDDDRLGHMAWRLVAPFMHLSLHWDARQLPEMHQIRVSPCGACAWLLRTCLLWL